MTVVQHEDVISEIIQCYGFGKQNYKYSLLGNGLINQTYLVEAENQQPIVLQCLNRHVFPDLPALMANTKIVCQHLTNLHSQGLYSLDVMQLVPTQTGELLSYANGSYWRALSFISQSESFEKIINTKQAYQVAFAFGHFNGALFSCQAERLVEVIANFHNLSFRYKQLNQAIKQDKCQRVSQCQTEINYLLSQQFLEDDYDSLCAKLPLRITHNDNKINNLLFDQETGEALAVVDLDTCMPGYLLQDFGDMARSACAVLAEDSDRFAEVDIDTELFDSLAHGYLSALKGKITKQEQASLLFGVKLMPLMLAVRFLTDFLEGDQYFHIDYDRHNWVRANNQLHLYRAILAKEPQLSRSF